MENTTQNESSTGADLKDSLDYSKNTKLIDQQEIEGTPFRVVRTEKGSFISIGTKRITDFLTEKEVLQKSKELRKHDWKLLLAIFSVITQETVAQLHIEMMKFNQETENLTNN